MSELKEITQTAEDAVTEAVESQEAGAQASRWHRQVALTTLVMALLAALGGLLSGATANEALLDRTLEIIEAEDLEGDRLLVETLKSKHEILIALGEAPDPVEVATVTAFEGEIQELEVDTVGEETQVRVATSAHTVFAIAVTLLSLGITLGGMAVVVERKLLWTVGLAFGAAGAVGVGLGILNMLS